MSSRHRQNLTRSQIFFTRPSFFLPPDLTQHIRHFTEFFSRVESGSSHLRIAEYLPLPAGKNIHDYRCIGKIKSRVAGIQNLQQTAADIQLLAQVLTAADGTVFAVFHIFHSSAGKTAILLFFHRYNNFIGYCRVSHIQQIIFRSNSRTGYFFSAAR